MLVPAMRAASLKLRAVARFQLGPRTSNRDGSSQNESGNQQRNTTRRIAQTLPREVLQAILACLTSQMFIYSFPFTYGSDVWSCPANPTEIVCAIHALYCAVLVCRSWHTSGIPILYSAPALLTGRRIQLFKRTLQHIPSMSRHVKDIILLDFEESGLTPLRVFRRNGKHQQQVLADLIAALDACRALVGLAIRNQSGLGYSFLKGSCGMARSLRKLTIYGKSLHGSFSELEFPSLEILCLRDVPYSSVTLGYPLMPRLKTLQLVISYMSANIQFAFRPGYPPPPLQSLEFYGAHCYGTLVDADSLSYFSHLDRLHLIGQDELRTFIVLAQPTAELFIRHLILGVIPTHFSHLEDWRFPPTLETLTLFVDLVPVLRDDLLSDKTSLTTIPQCLRFNEDQIASGNFRHLVINAISDLPHMIQNPRQYQTTAGIDEPLLFVNLKDFSPGPIFSEIQELCNSLEIKVDLNHTGTSTCQFPGKAVLMYNFRH